MIKRARQTYRWNDELLQVDCMIYKEEFPDILPVWRRSLEFFRIEDALKEFPITTYEATWAEPFEE